MNQPPIECARCHRPIRKFWKEGDEWHPCGECEGALCEGCCDLQSAIAEPVRDLDEESWATPIQIVEAASRKFWRRMGPTS